MAEASALAFGKYLRQLRERRGLSLGQVCELIKNSPEPIDKGTLSRLERGQQAPSFFRLGPITRIYEISADALLERMELDRELDRLEGPETGGKSYDELHALGVEAVVKRNRSWDAYAYFRDAAWIAPDDKRGAACLNLAGAIRSLGKNALALHELREAEAAGLLNATQRAIVHERLSMCCRCLGDMRRAAEYADSAIAQARALGDARAAAYAISARAGVAVDEEQWETGYGLLMEALSAYRQGQDGRSGLSPSVSFEPMTLLTMAECSLQLANPQRARRLTLSALRMSEANDLPLGLAYSELLLGWIDEGMGRVEAALARWRRAIVLAERIDSSRIAFAAEVEIYRLALNANNTARARASRRRLERLVPWIPRHIPAYQRFKKLIGQEGESHGELPKVRAVGDPGGVAPGAAVRKGPDRGRPAGRPGVVGRISPGPTR